MARKYKKIKLLSVIIPAYREERTIDRCLIQIRNVLNELEYNYEIIVVVDGFVDKTLQKAKSIQDKKIIVVGYEQNRGKGYAVRYGMEIAKGDIIAFIDAGTDIDPNGFSLLLNHMFWYDADIICGSKLHPVSIVHYPLPRRVLSWGYRLLTRVLFGLRVRDTQAGMKFFKRNVIDDVVPRLLVKKFAFDIELLAVANYLGYTRIYEAPIRLNFSGVSTITSKNFWKITLHMLWDTLAVFYRLKILRYYDKQLQQKKFSIHKKRINQRGIVKL